MKDASEWIRNYERFWQGQLDSLEAYLEEAGKEEKSHGKKSRGKTSHSKNRSNL